MAQSVGTLALKTVLDGGELTTGLNRQSQEVKAFADLAKTHGSAAAGAFSAARDKAAAIFGDLKAGNFAGAFGGLTDAATAAAAGLGSITAGVGLVVGAIAGIGLAARSASKEINELNKFAQRIGTDVPGAGRLTRVLERGGVEDPEQTLSRFRQRLGAIRTDPTGASAGAFRQLGLDPQALLGQGTEQAFQSAILALGRVGNSFDQAHLSQEIFGKGFGELQELVRQGGAAFERAAQQERLFGPGEGTIEAAVNAEKKWKEVGHFFGDLWSSLSSGATAAFTRISEGFADVGTHAVHGVNAVTEGIARLLTGLPNIEDDVPTIGRQRGGNSRSAAEIQAGAATDQVRQRTEFERTLAAEAQRRGLVGANATRQEVEAVKDLVQGLQERRKQLEGSPDNVVASSMREAEQAARAEANRRAQQRRQEEQRANSARVDQAITSGSDARELRNRAELGGLVRPNATREEVEQVKDLAEAYIRVNGNIREVRRLQAEAQARRVGAVDARIETGQEELRLRRMSEVEGMTNGRIQERLALEKNISAEKAAQLRAVIDQGEALTLRGANRTPLEQFNETNRQRAQNREIDPETRDRDLAARFRQLTAGLGQGPSSFGLSGTSSTSAEGLRRADDFRIRGETERDPQWAARMIEAVQRQEEILDEQTRRIVDAIRSSGLAVADV